MGYERAPDPACDGISKTEGRVRESQSRENDLCTLPAPKVDGSKRTEVPKDLGPVGAKARRL
jgi:hypothetical protein